MNTIIPCQEKHYSLFEYLFDKMTQVTCKHYDYILDPTHQEVDIIMLRGDKDINFYLCYENLLPHISGVYSMTEGMFKSFTDQFFWGFSDPFVIGPLFYLAGYMTFDDTTKKIRLFFINEHHMLTAYSIIKNN